jgi:periplasmic protein TonB
MFDDFTPSPDAKKSRSRLRGSVLAACVLYISGGAMLVAATAGANRRLEIEVETIKGPPPEAPAPTVERPAPQADKPQVKAAPRRKMLAPKAISTEKIEKSTAALVGGGDTGPVDPAPPEPPPPPPPPPAAPPPPPPPPEPVIAAVEIEARRPKYPERCRDLQIEGVVVVEFDVLADGSVSNIHIISGDMCFHDAVTRAVATWRFKPARRGQLAVLSHKKQTIRFNFSD